MNESGGQLKITAQQNSDFAALSGDYNPLHVDEIYARRLQFGHPVIHGIHHMLRVWDAAYLGLPSSADTHLTHLSATFPNPASIGQTITYDCRMSPDQSEANLSAYCQGKQVLSLKLRFCSLPEAPVDCLVSQAQPPIETPVIQSFPPHQDNGACRLYLDAALSHKLFPSLSQHYPSHQLAQILACTRVVGMKCPGLHSIFSRIKLNFQSKTSVADKAVLRYFAVHQDARVKILKLGVKAQGLEGSLDTFFRPTPVTQPGFAEIRKKVAYSAFCNQRALVVGGSRGVGETTAKVLAAGGAEVIFTYNKGRAEADQVEGEITREGARCRALQLDVTTLSGQSPTPFDGELLPTHIYYFASPHIVSNRTKIWDADLYSEFCRFYLDAFSRTVELYGEAAAKAQEPITIFYPSSVFIDKPERGFSEYAVAKGAGEALCNQLTSRYHRITFVTPRLPRMSTDQTSSIIPIPCESVFDVMHRELLAIAQID